MIVFNTSCRKKSDGINSAEEFADNILMRLQLHQIPEVEVGLKAKDNHIALAFSNVMKSKRVTQHHVMQNLTITGVKRQLAIDAMSAQYLLG